MQFYSTKNRNLKVDLKEAILRGLPQDNGLFMPERIPKPDRIFFKNLPDLSLQDIAFRVSKIFFGDDLSDTDLQNIVRDAINFDAPLKRITENTYALELFHGPTLAFKDFGARFMSRLMARLISRQKQNINILVATSGDTGSAVAQGFYDVEGINVVILYPSGKVSKIQEQQIATLDKNITSLEIEGTFDDCQHLVKSAFLDKELSEQVLLSSANSINIARLIPQSFYYFYAFGQMQKIDNSPVVISVPSGNFGNLSAGLIAWRMGLPVHHFIAAVNANDTFPRYLKNGNFIPKSSIRTISNAMDVGNPSNLSRIFDMFDNNVDVIRQHISSFSFDDDVTRQTIKETQKLTGYLLDPHGAVGYKALQTYLNLQPEKLNGIVFETAHPAKFKDTVDEIINADIAIPAQLQKFMNKSKTSIRMSKTYSVFRDFLLKMSGQRNYRGIV